MVHYGQGLLRPTNLAMARGIGNGTFKDSVDSFLAEEGTSLDLTWGIDSELCPDDLAQELFGSDQRVTTRRIEGGRHAMVNDIALHTAIILQGVTEPK